MINLKKFWAWKKNTMPASRSIKRDRNFAHCPIVRWAMFSGMQHGDNWKRKDEPRVLSVFKTSQRLCKSQTLYENKARPLSYTNKCREIPSEGCPSPFDTLCSRASAGVNWYSSLDFNGVMPAYISWRSGPLCVGSSEALHQFKSAPSILVP